MSLKEYRTEQAKSMPFQCVVCSEVNERANNEDSFHIYDLHPSTDQPPIKILSVADGMGGYDHGEHVSRETLRKVSLALFEQLCVMPAINELEPTRVIDREAIAQALLEALEQANAYVQRMVNINKWGKAGSTIVIAALLGSCAVIANLGDSPAFHYQKSQKQLIKLTEDHTVTGALVRTGKITEEIALHHSERNSLEFYVGASKLPSRTPLHIAELSPGDLLLLCTDGISGNFLHKDMDQIVCEHENDLKAMVQHLIEGARQKGMDDNQTIIIYEYMEVPEQNHSSPTVRLTKVRKTRLEPVKRSRAKKKAEEILEKGDTEAINISLETEGKQQEVPHLESDGRGKELVPEIISSTVDDVCKDELVEATVSSPLTVEESTESASIQVNTEEQTEPVSTPENLES
jgi:serine/threonine protein phosphatase PrpC